MNFMTDLFLLFSWRSKIYRTALGYLLLVLSALASAQAELAGVSLNSKSLSMVRLNEEPRIDGMMDEAIWEQALLVTDLYQMNPFEYEEPSQRTEVRIFYTENAIFIGARMWDTQADEISASVLRQNANINPDDVFNIILDPFLDRRSGYRFAMNPNGVRWDAIYNSPTDMETNWQGIWQGESSMDQDGWTTEMRIPFQTLSFEPSSTEWGINFQRVIRRNNEEITWFSQNRQFNPGASGIATNMNGMRQGRGLDVVPGLTLRRERSYGSGVNVGVEESFEPTLDVFYKITPSLNAALTVNTDFSATEVDDRQVNLTRFSLFFPEKRDFFLRDSDIFEFGQIGTYGFGNRDGTGNAAIPNDSSQNARPFFSRTIGLSASGAPVDLQVGGKLSGRVGNLNVGSLLISQDEDVANGVEASEIFVGRAVMNVLSESRFGLIMTDGDPQSNLDSSLLGADFRYRNSQLGNDKILELNTWVQKSDTQGKQGDDMAYSLALSTPNNTGWRGGAVYNRVEKNFDPAVGFVSRTGIQDYALDGGYVKRLASGSYIRNVYMGFDGYRAELLNGGLNSEDLGVRIALFNQENDRLFTRVRRNREVLLNDFTIFRASDGSRTVVIPRGEYEFNQWLLLVNTAGQRRFSSNLMMGIGEYYHGDYLQLRANNTWRPSPRYEFGLNYGENSIKLPEGNFKVRQLSITANVAFNSRWSWSNYLQYDNVSEGLGFNSRLNWIPQAGQQAFLVFNYGAQDRDKDNNFSSTTSDLSLKFTYTFRY